MNAGDCQNCPIETADVTRRKGGEEGKRKGMRGGEQEREGKWEMEKRGVLSIMDV